jgi:hypothetical protein
LIAGRCPNFIQKAALVSHGRTDHDVLNGGPAHDRLMFAVAGRDARFVSR